jgi:ubiquitin carboxyl-terminal hydrolase 25/28
MNSADDRRRSSGQAERHPRWVTEYRVSSRFFWPTRKDADHPEILGMPLSMLVTDHSYLNSILQYLYSIKPLREAVLNFSQDTTPVKPEVERSKRCKLPHPWPEIQLTVPVVHQLRRLFLQLYKTEASAVRPDEELAYLAITRPEIDDIVQPEEPEKSTILDDMPTLASPSSTKVNTPEPSRPSSPMMRQASPSRSSVLGKRESQSRSPYASPGDRPRRSDGFIKLQEADAEADSDFQMIDVDEKSQPIHQEFADPPSSDDKPSSTAGMDMESLHLNSPDVEASEPIPPVYQPPPGPPPLPPRPRRDSKGTLNAGLKFGECP